MLKFRKIARFRKIKSYLFLLITICAIMMVIIKAYCATTLTQKNITFNDKIYSIYTDCIKFHVKANGYAKKIKEEMSNNFYEYAAPGPGRDLQTGNAKMQGYGNYVFKVETSLYNFIQYCYALNPGTTTDCCVYTGTNEANSCNYTKLCTFSGQALTSNAKTFVDNFWTRMTGTIGELFNQYQDLYFFEKYTNKGACLVFSGPNKYSEEKGKEFLTAMTSYIFTTNQNSAPNCEIKKGDIVPFLYVKEHTDDPDIKNSPKEIAKYAYLACINGWSEAASNDLWYEEYEAVFGEYDEEKLCEDINESLEELEAWYTETFEKYQEERGDSGNALLGATIDTIIKSDYSITQQLEATEYYLQNIEGIGDYKENMARNELMAKYMMENSHIEDLIKDYNVGIEFVTENLQYGTQKDKNTKTCILSDFQVLEFDHTLDKDGQSDDDGISDLTELTTNIKWMNITGPMQKYYYDMLGNGKTTKSFDEVIDDLCKKQGKYTDSGGNIVWGHLKYEGGKVYYKTRDYNSNPKLNDTDVDGLWDNIDKKPINNYIDASIDIDKNSSFNMTFGSDYRYFFIKNTKFNNELAEMSLIMANLSSNDRKINIDQDNSGNLSISNYMSELGFTLLDTINLYGGKGKCYIGKKEIQYYDVKKYVYGIFVGGFTDEASYKNLLFATDGIEDVFKEIADVIVDRVETYVKPDNYCYWITGLNIAGGVANLVACQLNTDETYAYVFGPPNISKDSGAYPYIKNIINADDIISKIYSEDEGYHINGSKYYKSIKYDMKKEYRQYVGNFNNYKGDYKVTNKSKNDIKQNKDEYGSSIQYNDMINMTNQLLFSDSIIGATGNYLLCRNDDGIVYAMSLTDIFGDIYNFFKNIVTSIFNGKGKIVSDGQGFKSYDVEVKGLDGFDENENLDDYKEVQDGGASSENSSYDYYDDWGMEVNVRNGKCELDTKEGYMKIVVPPGVREVEAYFMINGVANFVYDLNTNNDADWSAEVKARPLGSGLFSGSYIVLQNSIRGKDISYSKVFYNKGIIQNGYNEYIIRLTCLGFSNSSSVLRIGLVQHIDGANNDFGGIWEGRSDTIYPIGDSDSDDFYNQVFKKKTYLNSDLALFYALSTIKANEISDGERNITNLIDKLININDYFENIGVVKVYKNMKSLYENTKKVIEGTTPLMLGIKEVLKKAFDYGFRYLVDYEEFKINVCDEIGFNSYKNNYNEDIYEVSDGLVIGEKEVDIYNQNLFKYEQNCNKWDEYNYMIGQRGAKGDFK